MPVLGNQSSLSLNRALYQFAGLWKYIEVRPLGVLASVEVMTRLTEKKGLETRVRTFRQGPLWHYRWS
jgi:hypothetical protein